MIYCIRCGAEIEPERQSTSAYCHQCEADIDMLDDCEMDGRRETADFEAAQRERRDYHEAVLLTGIACVVTRNDWWTKREIARFAGH